MKNEIRPVFMFGEDEAHKAMLAAQEQAMMASGESDIRKIQDRLQLIISILGYQHDCRSTQEKAEADEWRRINRPIAAKI